MMKLSLPLLAAVLLLTACSVFQQWPAPVQTASSSFRPGLYDAERVNALFTEANRLAGKVGNGELSRTQAAEQLNVYRLRLVGNNVVDNSTFATYYDLAQKRDAGKMSQEESQARMEGKLRDWQRRWPTLTQQPSDPAFTNFLMQLYSLPPLVHSAR